MNQASLGSQLLSMHPTSNFQSRCDKAARNSNGNVAQQLLREILPLVRVSGAQVSFGPVERTRAACDLYANCRRFGLPTFFFTLAPDYRDPLTIRLGISRPTYSGFPYKDDDFREALHNWDIAGRPGNLIFQTDFRISPINTTSKIQDIVRKNATAQSIVYMSMLKAVFEGLLGISMDEHVKKTVPLSSRKNGIFGRARAASMSTECQGRGTLHGHCLAWVELTPQVIQRFLVDYDRLCPEPLHIFPRCFYFPPIRELIKSSPGIVLKASSMAWQVWIAYQIVRIKEDDYYKCVKDTAHVLARDSHNGMIDAFRIVARELFYSEPNSRACLWSTLEMADKFESQTLGMARTMRIWLHRS